MLRPAKNLSRIFTTLRCEFLSPSTESSTAPFQTSLVLVLWAIPQSRRGPIKVERYPGYVTGRPRKHPPVGGVPIKLPKHYPVRKYLGKYEAWLLTLYGSEALRFADHNLELFFSAFPKTWGLEQYASTDVEDYVRQLLASGKSEGAVRVRLVAIRRFWRWLIEDMGFPFFNIVPASKFHRKKKISPIAEGEIVKLGCCPTCHRRFRKSKPKLPTFNGS